MLTFSQSHCCRLCASLSAVARPQAKKFLAERSSQYMTARSAAREMKGLVDALWKPLVPTRPTWTTAADHQHLQGWKAYLAWEEKNPLDLDDPTALQARIQYAYKQALMHMRFYPELWCVTAVDWRVRVLTSADQVPCGDKS